MLFIIGGNKDYINDDVDKLPVAWHAKSKKKH